MMYGRGYAPGYGYGGSMMGGAGPLLMWLFFAFVVLGIALVVIWAMRSASGGHHMMMAGHHAGPVGPVPPAAPAGHDEAVAIAKRRFANGEITKEQYEEMMRTLGA